jgi:hypothetical protein
VRIYPNPLKDLMIIQSEKMIQHIEIQTISGEIVAVYKVNAQQIELPIELESGVYFVKLVTKGAEYTERICVQN